MRRLVWSLAALVIAVHGGAFSPCNGKAQLGGACDVNSDCDPRGSICLRSLCRCHPHYVEMAEDQKGNGGGGHTRCVPLPARIGADCSTKCREPLFCRSGKCQCVQRGTTTISNGECVSTSRVGDRCSRHYDCTAPFSACVNSQCICVAGTIQQGARCVAAASCPLGGVPGAVCVRRTSAQDLVENMAEGLDDCPGGHVCVTAAESPVGHCCPVVCPLASHPDARYTCEPNANISRCPSETHFCHRISGPGFAQAACCRRPCNALAPNALFIQGECMARGQLQAQCNRHEQCAGSESMQCVNGTCACAESFEPLTDSLSHSQRNPTSTCARQCSQRNLVRDMTCFQRVALDKHCFIQQQCPTNSGCYRGRCVCRCGFQLKGEKCVALPPPPTTTSQPLVVPGLAGGHGSELFGIIGKLFAGQTGNAGGGGGVGGGFSGLLGGSGG